MKKEFLQPLNGQKSFWKKATLLTAENGSQVLISYTTPVIERKPDGSLVRLWKGWSMTTGKHIRAFCGLNKKEFQALPCEEV